MKYFRLFLFLITFSASISCSAGLSVPDGSDGSGVNVSVVSWNVQTFFDGEYDGCEYSNFRDGSKWNKEKYLARLERLCNIIVELNADVYVFEEIENEGILYDIYNQLVNQSWIRGNTWEYSCFAKEEKSSIGCAVLSKYELNGLTTHCIDVRTECEKQPALRYLIETSLMFNDRKITVMANHWKSKVDGEESSETWRLYQEALVFLRLRELDDENGSVVICGDFNKDIRDFDKGIGSEVVLNGSYLGYNDSVSVKAGWYSLDDSSFDNTGSYYFKGNWEKIDSILLYGCCDFLKFEVCKNDSLCDEKGIPKGYKIYSGEGVSDHLPVKAYLRF